MPKDYYAALGVSEDASPEEIKNAFRTLAREYHPDATGDAASETKYKEISEAYAVLSDPQRRRQYDAARMGMGSWSSPFGSSFATTVEDIFETFFGGRGGTRTRQRTRARRGESIEVELDLTLEEVVFGGERTLTFERYEACERCSGQGTEPGTHPEECTTCGGTGQVHQERRTILGAMVTAFPCRDCDATGWVVPNPCGECRGTGRAVKEASITIDLPPGIDDQDRMRVSGEGEAGLAGGGRGDLFVRFRVMPDERFERLGDDLLAWVDIPMTTAALGGRVKIETLDGEHTLEIPAGTQPTTLFRMKDRGVPRRGRRGRGDLIVRANVVVPTKLGRKEKELLSRLAEMRGDDAESEGAVATIRRALGLD